MAKKKTQKTIPAQTQTSVPEGAGTRPVAAYAVKTPVEKPVAWWLPLALSAVFFLLSLFTVESTVKVLALVLLVVAAGSCAFRFSAWAPRITWPVAIVLLWVLLNGVSTLYAISGKFALREFLRLAVGLCVFLLILAWSREGENRGRTAASMLAGATALAGLVSIDMLSTRILSGSLYALLGLFGDGYAEAAEASVEAGVRMSTYTNPNTFAGMVGIGILLSLELAVTSRRAGERRYHLVCLFLNALSFLLVFSMGASATIAVAFLLFLFLERKERRGDLFILMVETLILCLLVAFPIYLTAFENWKGFQPVPLLCAAAGAALFCAADRFLGQGLGARLRERGRALTALILCALVLLALAGAVAVNVTGPITMKDREYLSRSGYPAPGTYTLDVDATGELQVVITSQNQHETMMHTTTQIYSGPAEGATFTVPEDSMVVYFAFHAQKALTLRSVTYAGAAGSGSLKLDYKLLPGFIANRLQGLFANQNAIQRTVFFADGIKLFRQSPVFGLGLGAYESAICSVQSFFYETKYAHNHYIETLVTTGSVGLLLFLGVLGSCAFCLWKSLRREDGSPLAPCLAAALVFMAGHAAVEVIFSSCYYLPVALGVFALICLCCGDALPLPSGWEALRSWATGALTLLMLAFGVTLYLNLQARSIASHTSASARYLNLERAAKMDLYEWSDYELTYVYVARGIDPIDEPKNYAKANEFAAHLASHSSNSTPPYVAEYYFSTGQRELAYQVLEKFVTYVASNSASWQVTFDLLKGYGEDTDAHRAQVAAFYERFTRWNADHMGSLTLSDANRAYITSVLG